MVLYEFPALRGRRCERPKSRTVGKKVGGSLVWWDADVPGSQQDTDTEVKQRKPGLPLGPLLRLSGELGCEVRRSLRRVLLGTWTGRQATRKSPSSVGTDRQRSGQLRDRVSIPFLTRQWPSGQMMQGELGSFKQKGWDCGGRRKTSQVVRQIGSECLRERPACGGPRRKMVLRCGSLCGGWRIDDIGRSRLRL